MPNYLKIALSIFFALAIALGLLQHQKLSDFSFGSNKTIAHFQSDDNKSLEDYYTAGQQMAVQNTNATTTATFLAVGDIMLSRNVAAEIQQKNDADYPFNNMAEVLKLTDFNFGNLESPLAPDTLPCHLLPSCKNYSPTKGAIIGGHSLIFAAPYGYIKGLEDYNFKIINLANNHAFDQGLYGIENTKLGLYNADELVYDTNKGFPIQPVGTGQNLDEAWTPAMVTANGIKICFVGASFSSVNDGGKAINDYIARIEDVEHLKSAITTAKGECDFVVATMHAGTEYTRNPNQAQTTFAHAAIDDGADIVIGAHPHWVQTIEKYDGKYIFYSLGNFIFDQAFSQDTSEGLTLKMTISKAGCHPGNPSAAEGYPGSSTGQNMDSGSGAGMTCGDNLQGSRQGAKLESIELLPVIIKNSAPRPATEQETKSILNKIGQTNTLLK